MTRLAHLGMWILLALATGVTSCNSDSTSAFGDETSIHISEDRYYFNGRSIYYWQTQANSAIVEVRIRGFQRGQLRVRIYDGATTTKFDRTYYRYGNGWIIGGSELKDVSFISDAVSGTWTIQLDYFQDFYGHLYLTVLDSEAQTDTTVDPAQDALPILDSTFGNLGRAAWRPDAGYGADLAVDASGRIVVVGTAYAGGVERSLAVWRFTAAGELDPTFGTDGVFLFTDPGFSGGQGVVTDGNAIVVTGWQLGGPNDDDLIVLRLTESGILDPAFGDGGIFSLDAGLDEIGYDLAADSGGNLVVVGSSRDMENIFGNQILLRLTPAGSRDLTFGTAGLVLSPGTTRRGRAVVLDASDRPVVLGRDEDHVYLEKYTTSGTLEPTFGSGGRVTSFAEPGGFRVGLGLTRSPAGRIAVSGLDVVRPDPPRLAVWSLLANGAPDPAFGQDGMVRTSFEGGGAAGTGIGFDAGGRLLVVGGTRTEGTETSDASATLWRFLPSGALDPSLPASGGTGSVRFDARTGSVATSANALFIAPDGSALAPGAVEEHITTAQDLVIWKLLP